MKFRIIILIPFLLFVTQIIGQPHTVTGKVIDEQLHPVSGARIFMADTVLLVTSDINGNFSVIVPLNIKTLLIGSIAMEWKCIELTNNCYNLDIILQPNGTYDFMPARKIDRLRKKQFDELPALHKSAFDNGIFNTEEPCYIDKFIPINKIHRARN